MLKSFEFWTLINLVTYPKYSDSRPYRMQLENIQESIWTLKTSELWKHLSFDFASTLWRFLCLPLATLSRPQPHRMLPHPSPWLGETSAAGAWMCRQPPMACINTWTPRHPRPGDDGLWIIWMQYYNVMAWVVTELKMIFIHNF